MRSLEGVEVIESTKLRVEDTWEETGTCCMPVRGHAIMGDGSRGEESAPRSVH